ncbi:chaperone protein HtpG [Striga asiatica]|uniref:Chaperone protein HtpG n=1 Tax=Striga asiatica TaxID=4170 RepID=A0A5A7PW05_STRAF|nr:chaperone protein HtpG [Striga asiatica]
MLVSSRFDSAGDIFTNISVLALPPTDYQKSPIFSPFRTRQDLQSLAARGLKQKDLNEAKQSSAIARGVSPGGLNRQYTRILPFMSEKKMKDTLSFSEHDD